MKVTPRTWKKAMRNLWIKFAARQPKDKTQILQNRIRTHPTEDEGQNVWQWRSEWNAHLIRLDFHAKYYKWKKPISFSYFKLIQLEKRQFVKECLTNISSTSKHYSLKIRLGNEWTIRICINKLWPTYDEQRHQITCCAHDN